MPSSLLLEPGDKVLLEDGGALLADGLPSVALTEGGSPIALEDGERLLLEPGTGTFDVPDTIPADGSVDVTAALQAWLNTVPDGGIARFAAGGIYNLEGTLLLKDRDGITLYGNGASLVAYTNGVGTAPVPGFEGGWPRWRCRFIVWGGKNVHITRFILRGGNPNAGIGDAAYNSALEAQAGVAFTETTGSSITDCEIYDLWGDFGYFSKAKNCLFARNYCRRNGRQGVAIVDGTGCWVVDNDIAEVRRTFFDIEANFSTSVIDDFHIERNTTGRGRLNWLSNIGASWHVHNIHIIGNTTTAESGAIAVTTPASAGGKRGPYILRGNTWIRRGTDGSAFLFTRVSGVYFSENTVTVPASRNMPVLELVDCDDAEFAHNNLTGHTVDVIFETT